MRPRSIAASDAEKSAPRSYRVGQFVIMRAKSRWRICEQQSPESSEFSTLGGAIAWCRQQSQQAAEQKFKPTRT